MRRTLCRSLRIASLLLVLHAGGANGALWFPSVVDLAAGARLDVAPVRSAMGDDRAALRVEIADLELYGISGLRASGARASGRVRSLILGGSMVNVASPVGAHTRAIVEAGFAIGDAWQGVVRVGAERLALDTTDAVTWRVAGVTSRIDVRRVSMLADLDVVEGHGSDETSLSLAARVRAGAAHLIGTVRIDGDRFAGAGIGAVARLHSSLALLAGYDDGSESLRAAVVIDWHSIEIATGVFQHPVLGVSQGVSVACVR